MEIQWRTQISQHALGLVSEGQTGASLDAIYDR